MRSTPAVAVAGAVLPRALYLPSLPPLAERLSEYARRLTRSTVLVPADRQFLKDVMKGRYPFRSLARMTRLAAQSENPAHRFGLCEVVRADIVRQSPALSLVRGEVFDTEDDTNARADKAVRAFDRCPCRAHRDAAIDALEAQQAAGRCALDVLYAWREGA